MQGLGRKDRKVSHSPASWAYKKQLRRSKTFKPSSMLTDPGYNLGNQQKTKVDIQQLTRITGSF